MDEYSKNFEKILSETKFAVEANSNEVAHLWKDFNEKLDWKDNISGYFVTVGHLAKLPICISMFVHKLNGRNILFYEPTSRVVDHEKINKWLIKKLHKDCKFTDAGNFHNIYHQIK